MDKPEDIAQWAWDKARDVAFDFDCDWTHDGRVYGDRLEADAIVAIARAILSAQSQAYIDAARIVEEFPYTISLSDADAALTGFLVRNAGRKDISAAILQRKEEIGR